MKTGNADQKTYNPIKQLKEVKKEAQSQASHKQQ